MMISSVSFACSKNNEIAWRLRTGPWTRPPRAWCKCCAARLHAVTGSGRLCLQPEEQFAQSILSPALVYASGYGIAIGEAAIGTLLLLGLFLRPALAAGTLLMILLLTGTCLIQNWSVAGIQMTYLAFYCALLATAKYDRLSIDGWRKSHSAAQDLALDRIKIAVPPGERDH